MFYNAAAASVHISSSSVQLVGRTESRAEVMRGNGTQAKGSILCKEAYDWSGLSGGRRRDMEVI